VKQGERRGVLTCNDHQPDKKKKRSIIAGPPALPERNNHQGKALERLPGDESISECIANYSADLFAADLDPQVSALTLFR
jgi:hypothetical protein